MSLDDELTRANALALLPLILARISPELILTSKEATDGLNNLFGRGTTQQCRALVGDRFKLSARRLPSVNEIGQYFITHGIRAPQVPRLVTAVCRLAQFDESLKTYLKDLWKPKNTTFLSTPNISDPIEGLDVLIRDINTLEKAPALAACATRLTILFVDHNVDHLEADVTPEELDAGRTRRAVAMNKISQKHDREYIHSLCRKSTKYLTFLEEAGPGILCRMGTQSDNWKRLRIEDIKQVCRYLRDHLELAEDKRLELDELAIRLIFQGLQNYGWAYKNLSGGKSKLMKLMLAYIDPSQLANNNLVIRIPEVETVTIQDSTEASPAEVFRQQLSSTVNTSNGNVVYSGVETANETNDCASRNPFDERRSSDEIASVTNSRSCSSMPPPQHFVEVQTTTNMDRISHLPRPDKRRRMSFINGIGNNASPDIPINRDIPLPHQIGDRCEPAAVAVETNTGSEKIQAEQVAGNGLVRDDDLPSFYISELIHDTQVTEFGYSLDL